MRLRRGADPGGPAGADSRGQAGAGAAEEEPLDDLEPSRMRWPEPLYGLVVAVELVVVAILNLAVRGGAGAPTHPNTALEVAGVLVSLAFGAIILTRQRTIVGFAAIIAAFFVTLPKVPNRLSLAHIFALVFPLAFALIITSRQRRLMNRQIKVARAGGGPARTGARREAQGRRGAAKRTPVPQGPRPNARYTPPKAKRRAGGGR